MHLAIVLPAAEADLAEIWEFIARDSLVNADSFVQRIFQTCQETLASNPLIGRTPEVLPHGCKAWLSKVPSSSTALLKMEWR